MWQTSAERLALLELLVRGTLKRRRAQAGTWDALAELPWVKRTGRRDELGLAEDRRGELVGLLERVWPVWGDVLAALTARGLPPTPEGWTALEDATRAAGLSLLPDRLNRRTAAALLAAHSKAALTERRIAALAHSETTHDGSVRLRPPGGVIAHCASGSIDLSGVASILGEVSIPERTLRDGLTLEGAIRGVLLVENLGAFCDLPSVEGWLLAHVAGWDTATVRRLLELLEDTPVVHFGDLDPNGVRIYRHLRGMHRNLQWLVPEFWNEYVDSHAIDGRWPEDLDVQSEPPFLQQLKGSRKWLEQEPVAVDPRIVRAIHSFAINATPPAFE